MTDDALSPRVRRYVSWGFFVGACLCVFLLPAVVLTGNRPLARYGLTPLEIAALYVLAGTLGGALVGVLYPITRWFLGAFLLGAIALLPVYLGFALLLAGDTPLSARWVIGAVPAFFVGGGLGAHLWSGEHKHAGPNSRTIVALWIVAIVCQVPGWYLGMRWAGEAPAVVGLGLVFFPPFVAALATLARQRQPA
jgi:hypothetical protein